MQEVKTLTLPHDDGKPVVLESPPLTRQQLRAVEALSKAPWFKNVRSWRDVLAWKRTYHEPIIVIFNGTRGEHVLRVIDHEGFITDCKTRTNP